MSRWRAGAGDGAKVRAHLLRGESALLCSLLSNRDWPPSQFRGALVDILERGDLPPAPKFTDAELEMPFGAGVRALRDGEAFTFYRESLPAQHPLRHAGGLYDVLLLTAADEVVLVD